MYILDYDMPCNSFVWIQICERFKCTKIIGPANRKSTNRKNIWSANHKSANCHICGRSAKNWSPQIADLLYAKLICGPPAFGKFHASFKNKESNGDLDPLQIWTEIWFDSFMCIEFLWAHHCNNILVKPFHRFLVDNAMAGLYTKCAPFALQNFVPVYFYMVSVTEI